MFKIDEVYQAAMQSGQGGIRWNSVTNYIQLMDENKNWTNWSYYNPTAPVSLIPTDIDSNTYRRADGVNIKLYDTNSVPNIFRCFKMNNSAYEQRSPITLTIEFSVPQVMTLFTFYNYSSGTYSASILVQSSVDGSVYEDLLTYRTSGANSAKESINLSNPQASKCIRFTLTSGGNYSNQTLYMQNVTLYGYSYSS